MKRVSRLMFAIGLVSTYSACMVTGCGSSAKLMHGLSIEELKPVPGILPSARLIKGTITNIAGDRVEVQTRERAAWMMSSVLQLKPTETSRRCSFAYHSRTPAQTSSDGADS